jgi:hypothetical protein
MELNVAVDYYNILGRCKATCSFHPFKIICNEGL